MLDRILKRADFLDGSTFSADEVARWPLGALDHLLAVGLIREIALANGVVCDQCEDACWIEPEIRERPDTGKRVGVYFCWDNEDVGRFEVSLDRFRRWEVHWAGLAAAAAKALSVAGSAEEIVSDRLCCLGRIAYADKSLEVFLGRGMAWSDASTVFGGVPRLQSTTPTLVLVPAVTPAPARWCRSAVPLTEIARLDDTGFHVDVEELRRRIGGWTPKAERTQSRKAKAFAKRTLLLKTILTYHKSSTGDIIYEPATQKQLAKLSGLSQPGVCRVLEQILGPKPMSTYHKACSQGALEGFLTKLADNAATPDAASFRPFQPTAQEECEIKNA